MNNLEERFSKWKEDVPPPESEIINERRMERKFESLNRENRKALIPFITAGDPDLETTEKLVLEMERQGADLIELGVPFSDPIAEGPVIQDASQRSLEAGTTLLAIFEMVRRLRKHTQIPLLLMMYANMIVSLGQEQFFALCNQVGIDGVIVPDLPYEEQGEIREMAQKYHVHSIHMVAPTSQERIATIAKDSTGFLYCVSSTGVTGVRSNFTTDFHQFFATIKKHAKIPCAVGFGISTPEQVKEMKQYCDGVIVGSAIVRIIGKEKQHAVEPVGAFVATLRAALDAPTDGSFFPAMSTPKAFTPNTPREPSSAAQPDE